jgi:serine/threonine protein kinase/tetratricopeptide (TPR) repeat protein
VETKQEWERIKELFGAALERGPSDRDAFLRAACGTDVSLRQEVESLIKAHESGSNLWQHPLTSQFSGNTEGRFIGPYQLVKKIGEGGMGQVWLAQQTAPLQRQVALKLIRWGAYDDTLLHRFQAERQSLAVMDHPSIAKVFDAGATQAGQPYFVMEYVAGLPITDYCDQKKLKIRDRLELFVKVCEGVQHAHQKAIIHRDLKPANILVAEVDGRPVPRIIDFGLAKAINRDVAEVTLNTRIGDLVGTPGYMSPEQCDPAARDIDTRADVYSLGVVLYVLLTGSVPFETKEWKDQPFDEILRRLREQDPVRPSTKINADHQTASSAAAARATEPKQLVRDLRGDLDWITMKAVDRDRARRYPTATDLAADIRRYLNHEAVLAVPPSLSYRAHKFARRYRGALITASVFALVLIAAAVISIRQSIRATKEAAVAQGVNDFLRNDLLAQASAATQAGPRAKPDPDLKVRTALDRAAERIEGKFAKQPEVEAAIRDTIGQTYTDLGLHPEAAKQLERALDLRRRVLGAEHPDTLRTMSNLAAVYDLEGKNPQAETMDSQILEIRRRVLGPDNPDTLKSMMHLAFVYNEEGKYAQAEALQRQTLEIKRRVLGPEHPDTLASIYTLAIVYEREGKYAQAEQLNSQALEIRRRVLGPEHPATLASMNNLAIDYQDEGKYAQAEGLDTQALEIERRVLGPEHRNTLNSMNNLAIVYWWEGKYAQAEALFSQTLEIRRRVLGPEHPATLNSMNNLAGDYADEGKYAQAEALFNQTLGIERRVLGPEHPYTLDTVNSLVVDYQKQGKYALAETYAAQVLATRRRVFGPEQPNTILSESDLALADLSQGKFVQSEPLARESVELCQKTQPDDWQRFRAESLLGASLVGQKKYAEAEPLLLEGYQGMLARKPRISSSDLYHLQLANQWIVRLYKDWGKPQKAAEIEKEPER